MREYSQGETSTQLAADFSFFGLPGLPFRAYADARRDADPLLDAPADDASAAHQVTGDRSHIVETFVDAVDLLAWPRPAAKIIMR